MKILVTGATGFVGQALCKKLIVLGHQVIAVSRSRQSVQKKLGKSVEVLELEIEKQAPSIEVLKDVGAIVHLAGDPVAEGRWSADKKRRIIDSRVHSTRNLVQSLQSLKGSKPQVMVTASAIGFYGDRGDEELTEESQIGSGFLADVCKLWEAESLGSKADSTDGVRRVALRLGVVLGKGGGALSKMLPVFSKGLGGPIAGGKQWMSWIHIDDLIGLIVMAIENPKAKGVINAVSENPVTNSQFSDLLAQSLGTKSWVPVPGFALKLAMGEASHIVLDSQRVFPKRAQALGYQFRFSELTYAFADILRQGEKGEK